MNDDLVQPCGHVHDTMEASAWCDIQTRLVNSFYDGLLKLLADAVADAHTDEEFKAGFDSVDIEAYSKKFGDKVKEMLSDPLGNSQATDDGNKDYKNFL